MPEISHRYNTADVAELANRAREMYKANNNQPLTDDQKIELKDIAKKSGGEISTEERDFLNYITDSAMIDKND